MNDHPTVPPCPEAQRRGATAPPRLRPDTCPGNGSSLVGVSNLAHLTNITQERDIDALGAVLEVLEAAQLERDNNGAQGLLGEDIVLGLLIAARRITSCLSPAATCSKRAHA